MIWLCAALILYFLSSRLTCLFGSDVREDTRTFCACRAGGVRPLSVFSLACGMQDLKEMWEGISYGGGKITNIPVTASVVRHLLPFTLPLCLVETSR